MPQHDYVISNDSGANVRADLNNAFQAILTNNSGASAPSTTASGSLWLDTSDANIYYLKMRNHTNDGWTFLGEYTLATKLFRPMVDDDALDAHLDVYTVKAITSTDNAIPKFNLESGQIQNTGILVDDSNNISGLGTIASTGNQTITNGSVILNDGYGIDFGATVGSGSTSTLLDDYEEGTWTPTAYSNCTIGSIGITKYTKIGNMVFAMCFLNSFTTTSSGFAIAGLPFICSNANGLACINYNNQGNSNSFYGNNYVVASTNRLSLVTINNFTSNAVMIQFNYLAQ